MPEKKYFALIVGGGSGSRMQSDIPKQFMLLNGRPVLMHTIQAFHTSSSNPEIIVVLHSDFHQYWRDLCQQYNFTIAHKLVAGGEHRFHSVRNGLKDIRSEAIVAVHDAVRPCIRPSLIDAAYTQAKVSGSAVAAIKSRDSVRQKSPTGSTSLKRENIYLVQTPQVFGIEVLKKAYMQDFNEEFTDDASVVEKTGAEIRLIEGDVTNIKITYPDDIGIAGMYLPRS
ncbi:2-C-methyl-D-erythritol 4-phosphate cytidylyltransferase [Daejeonella sp. JGW-45]|uniref:2-C-methyl-D-erythritol 4-phosphate cytidylyltransferase n=1 Tax=Daejeonella sp. JGW-45 TaxID=3034148 RepID=UPI0023EB550B|nr:2-C-methyl-D-erythritol 4-phosphate cytidylyltransferase [Daejeonella sp. JGW-45]